MNASSGDTARTWPFWAPSERAAVLEALELAGVGPGTTLVDLGCGDGQVLAAAASLGASVAGIEADPELVDEARAHLAAEGIEGDVVHGDLFDEHLRLDADVHFAYLAPATLQRLLPRLVAGDARRLVTVDFDVPGLVPSRRSGAARLYRLPGRRRPLAPVGWPSAGTLVATVPDVQSLSCLELVHPAGPTRVRASPGLARVATAFSGADRLDPAGHLAVDLRWEGGPSGGFAGGTLSTEGAGSHAVFVVFGDTEEVWEIDHGAVQRLRGAMRRARPPSTADEVLAVADGQPSSRARS